MSRWGALLALGLAGASCSDPAYVPPLPAPAVLRFSATPFLAPLPFRSRVAWSVEEPLTSLELVIRVAGRPEERRDLFPAREGALELEVLANAELELLAGGPGGRSIGRQSLRGLSADPVEIERFIVTPPRAAPGDPIEVSWLCRGADRVSLHLLPGEALLLDGPPSGRAIVRPRSSGILQLSAFGAGAPAVRTATVTLEQLPPLVVGFSILPPAAEEGSIVVLSYSVIRADAVEIFDDEGVLIHGSGELSGALGVPAIGRSRTLTIRASRQGQTDTASLFFRINPREPPQILAFSLTPTITGPGGDTVARYRTTGARSLELRWEGRSLELVTSEGQALLANLQSTARIVLVADNGLISATSTRTWIVDRTRPEIREARLLLDFEGHAILEFAVDGADRVRAVDELGLVLAETSSRSGSLIVPVYAGMWLEAENRAGRTAHFLAP